MELDAIEKSFFHPPLLLEESYDEAAEDFDIGTEAIEQTKLPFSDND